MGGTRFMVQWEEHPSHLATRLGQLLEHQTLVDVTLMCNTHTLRVHRAVLAACSPYFETILQRQLGMHPLIVLKDMQFSVLKSLIEFMYCGETSVTEDNLGALLQAAKFFQVKGLSAMTKEALGLVPNAKSTINGDAARKAFVGRPKRVGMQQTFVTSGLKTVSASHASSSHSSTSNELPTLPTKTTFQTISKPITARPDTQQQTDTAQLLLSLSGSEFPKQTFHTVSKNVRFQHNVSSSTVSVESPRSSNIDGNIKTKEVVGRLPVVTPNGGKSSAANTTSTPTTVSQQGGQIVEHAAVGSIREDVLVTNPQSVYVAEGHRRRGRPVKRQMNMIFQERVMTDADAALHKEAEASRKALEMLRQEMSSETIETNVAASTSVAASASQAAVVSTSTTPTTVPNVVQISNVSNELTQKGLVKQGVQSGSKLQVQSVQTSIGTTSRTVTATQNVSNSIPNKKINTNVYKTSNNTVTSVPVKKSIQEVASLPTSEITNNISIKADEPEIPQPVYGLPSDSTPEGPKEENIEYQVTDENVEGESDISGGNTNIVYQMADTNNTSAGSVMSQYMEVLKEAGLPTDVPILLDSGDGSYVTVNEEVLMNIVNGGVLQCHVAEGNFVAGDGVEFIVQEITEDEMEAVQAQVQEQTTETGAIGKEMETPTEISQNLEESEITPEVKPSVEETQLISECIDPDRERQEAIVAEADHPDVSREILESEAVHMQNTEVAEELLVSHNEGSPKEADILDETNGTCIEPEIKSQVEIKEEVDSPITNNENKDVENDVCSMDLSKVETTQENLKSQSHGDEMSVEQALQAMMGEGSDTEMEVSTNEEVQGAVKDESVVSGLETVTQSLKEEKSEDLQLVLRSEEGTEEDLRLVLSNDGGEVIEDNSSACTLISSHNVADNEGSLTVDHSKENIDKRCEEVTNSLILETNHDVGVHESVSDTSVCESSQFESVHEQIAEPKHIIEPLQVESDSREAPRLLGCTTEDPGTVANLGEVFPENENDEYLENTPCSEMSGDSQEVSQLTSNTLASAEAVCNSSEYPKSKGAIISPSKDIPFAVGLLPLKTALEKLQAMPEYHPRKTRSSSTGKESADMPAARVKRKASGNEGTDKRFKLSPAADSSIVEQPAAEEPYEGEATMEVVASVSEESKEETVLSMPELVTEPTEG